MFFGIVCALFGGTTVTYQTAASPALLPTTQVGITNVTRLTSSPSGLVLFTGRGADKVGYLLLKISGTFVQSGGNLFPDGFGRQLSIENPPRLIDGSFVAQDQKLFMGSHDNVKDARGLFSARAISTATTTNPVVVNICNDATPMVFPGGLFDTTAILGSGPDISSDGNVYMSVVRNPGVNRTVGVYKLNPVSNGGYCQLTNVFMTDSRYDIVHVWRETLGSFVAERSKQNTVGNLNTEIVRYSATGAVTVLASTDSSVLPILKAVDLSTGLVSDPTGTTFSFAYRSADSKYHVMFIRDGVMKEAPLSSPLLFATMTRAVNGDWILYATTNAQSVWTALSAVNIVTGAQADVASPSNTEIKKQLGLTVSTVDPALSGIDVSGNAYFFLPNAFDRMITATIPAIPNLTINSFTVTPASITAGDSAKLSWTSTGGTSASIDQGVGSVPSATGTVTVSPTVTTTYTLIVYGPGNISATSTATVTVTPKSAPPVIDSFKLSIATVVAGTPVTLSWSARNVNSTNPVAILGLGVEGGLGLFPATGSFTAHPGQTTTYFLTASGPNGIATASQKVTVVLDTTPAFTAAAVVNAASFKVPVSAGSLASVFGTNLSNDIAQASSLPLPRTLAGTQVLVNGSAAPLVYVSPGQINFQVSLEAKGPSATIQVVSSLNGTSSLVIIPLSDTPGLFVSDGNVIAQDALDQNGRLFGNQASPAKAGDVAVVYATGLGPTTGCDVKTGEASPAALCPTLVTPTVNIGGQDAQVLYSGLTPGFVGLYQINLIVPAVAPGTTTIVVDLNGQKSSDSVQIVLQ